MVKTYLSTTHVVLLDIYVAHASRRHHSLDPRRHHSTHVEQVGRLQQLLRPASPHQVRVRSREGPLHLGKIIAFWSRRG